MMATVWGIGSSVKNIHNGGAETWRKHGQGLGRFTRLTRLRSSVILALVNSIWEYPMRQLIEPPPIPTGVIKTLGPVGDIRVFRIEH